MVIKFNWGTGIVLAFATFIGFIMFFVIRTATDSSYKYELVSEKYYENELKFQHQIDAVANEKQLKESLKITQDTNQLSVSIPTVNNSSIVGEVHFYRPSNEKLDFTVPIHKNQSLFVINKNKLAKGKWIVQVSWYYANQKNHTFYKEQTVFI